MFIERSVADFMDALASSEPTPGGGSTAALAGALAAGLVSMVCQLTIGKRRFRDVEAALQEILAQAEALRQRMAELMEQDAAAYTSVMGAYRLPNHTPEEQQHRQSVMLQAIEKATFVPLEIAEGCAQILELALPAAEMGNPWAVSDAGAAALLAEAALHAALLNVHINLRNHQDTPLAADARRRMDDLMARAGQKDRILELVHQRIASGS
jgi:methenyltetrahydrofolate cyclohydrolase